MMRQAALEDLPEMESSLHIGDCSKIPKYVFGFSNGHVGTTSLSEPTTYCKGACTDASSIAVRFELGMGNGLTEGHEHRPDMSPGLRQWYNSRPGEPADSTAAREASLVHKAYIPAWRALDADVVLYLSHDILFLY